MLEYLGYAAGVLWIAYGVGSTDWPVIATNAGMVELNCAILAAKIRFRDSARDR